MATIEQVVALLEVSVVTGVEPLLVLRVQFELAVASLNETAPVPLPPLVSRVTRALMGFAVVPFEMTNGSWGTLNSRLCNSKLGAPRKFP